MIDWQTTQYFTAAIHNIVAILSAIALAIIAYLGLKTWKIQLRGNTQFDLARRFLRSAYKVRDAVNHVRNPFAGGSEFSLAAKAAGKEIDLSNPENHAEQQELLYQYRWQQVVEEMREFQAVCIEGEVLWGNDTTQAVVPLRTVVGELYSYIIQYLHHCQNPRQLLLDEHRHKMDDALYSRDAFGAEPNQFDVQISRAFDTVEQFIKPFLKI